jgi:TLD
VLLNQEQKEWLASIIPKYSLIKSKIELIYRASRDGWTTRHFHEYCDNKGPTVTLFKTKGGKVCGGYTCVEWRSSEDFWCKDSTARVFSVNDRRFFVPTQPKKAVYQFGLAGGPAFGCNTLTVQEATAMNAPNNGRCHTDGVNNEYFGVPNDA